MSPGIRPRGISPRAGLRGRSLGGPDPGRVTGPELWRATPRLRFRRSGRIASVGQRLAGLSQEGSLSTSGGGSPQSGRAPFGAEPGGRAPFGAAGRHLARPGAIWRGRAPFGASREVVTSRRVPVEGGKLTWVCNHCISYFQRTEMRRLALQSFIGHKAKSYNTLWQRLATRPRVEWPEKGRRTRDRKRQVAQGFDRDRRPAGVPKCHAQRP